MGKKSRKTRRIWENVDSYVELQELMMLFLDGKLETSPWHGDPVDEETVPLLQNLINIVMRGFVTVESQPGTCDEHELQRAYITGFWPKENMDEFISAMVDTGKLIVVVMSHSPPLIFGLEADDTGVWSKNGKLFLSITMDRESKEGDFRMYTNKPLSGKAWHEADNTNDLNRRFAKILRKETDNVTVIRKLQCKEDLDGLVLETLELNNVWG